MSPLWWSWLVLILFISLLLVMVRVYYFYFPTMKFVCGGLIKGVVSWEW